METIHLIVNLFLKCCTKQPSNRGYLSQCTSESTKQYHAKNKFVTSDNLKLRDDEWSVACGCRLELVEVHHSSGLHVAATVWCGVSAMSGGFQVGGVQAADVSPSL
jgi:hypothetical protein